MCFAFWVFIFLSALVFRSSNQVSLIIQYIHRFLSRAIIKKPKSKMPRLPITNLHCSIGIFNIKIPNSGFIYGLSGPSISYSVSHGLNVTFESLKNSKKATFFSSTAKRRISEAKKLVLLPRSFKKDSIIWYFFVVLRALRSESKTVLISVNQCLIKLKNYSQTRNYTDLHRKRVIDRMTGLTKGFRINYRVYPVISSKKSCFYPFFSKISVYLRSSAVKNF